VIGSGTVLDTSRLKYVLSRRLNVDARNCHTYIIGEHGDSEVPTWSLTNIAGIPIGEFDSINDAELENMRREVVRAAYDIIEKKGATYYAIALAVARITECIAGEENSFLTVSSVLEGEYGIDGAALSVPVKLSGYGIEWIPEISFAPKESEGLRRSAETMKEIIKRI
jgi:L-lactate dehydrogenase